MSLLTRIAKFGMKLTNVAGALAGPASMIPGPIGAIGRVATIGSAVVGLGSGFRKALPALPGVGSAIANYGGKALGLASAAATASFVYDQFGRKTRVNKNGRPIRSRRINPMNYKALRRSLKRVCMAKNLADDLNRIEIKGHKAKRRGLC